MIVFDIIECNIEWVEVGEKDIVLEIGFGLGVFMDLFSKRVGKVYVIEKDCRIVEILRREYNWLNVEIIEGDVFKVEWLEFNKMVLNFLY